LILILIFGILFCVIAGSEEAKVKENACSVMCGNFSFSSSTSSLFIPYCGCDTNSTDELSFSDEVVAQDAKQEDGFTSFKVLLPAIGIDHNGGVFFFIRVSGIRLDGNISCIHCPNGIQCPNYWFFEVNSAAGAPLFNISVSYWIYGSQQDPYCYGYTVETSDSCPSTCFSSDSAIDEFIQFLYEDVLAELSLYLDSFQEVSTATEAISLSVVSLIAAAWNSPES